MQKYYLGLLFMTIALKTDIYGVNIFWLVSIASHKQIIIIIVAVVVIVAAAYDDYDYGDYEDYHDVAAATSSDILKGVDVSRLIRWQIVGHVLSLTVPHFGL